MRKFGLIAGVALLHAVLSVGLFLVSFSMGMHNFDTGMPVGVAEKGLKFISNLLFCPILYPLVQWRPQTLTIFDGLLGYVPIFLNSLLWGIGACWLYSRHKSLKPAGPHGGPAA